MLTHFTNQSWLSSDPREDFSLFQFLSASHPPYVCAGRMDLLHLGCSSSGKGLQVLAAKNPRVEPQGICTQRQPRNVPVLSGQWSQGEVETADIILYNKEE